MTGFEIRRNRSRFASRKLRDAINLIIDHHQRIYATEEAAMQRCCTEMVDIYNKYGAYPDPIPSRRGQCLVIADDTQGVVFVIFPAS
jgi:hypothetical protein